MVRNWTRLITIVCLAMMLAGAGCVSDGNGKDSKNSNSEEYAAKVTGIKVMVPAYFYPGVDQSWERLNAQAKKMPGRLHAILNPNSGPGSSKDENYDNAVKSFKSNGGKIIAYVDTNYGTIALATVKENIDKYYNWYPVDGIFFDQFYGKDNQKVSYYKELYTYIKSKNASALVVGNPGTNVVENYLKPDLTADVLCIYEDKADNYGIWEPAKWTANYDAKHFYTLIHTTSAKTTPEEYRSYITRAAYSHQGWIYCTNDVEENPWDTLPDYFEDFCAEVAKN